MTAHDGAMTAQDPDEDARRLSGEALRRGDATGWFERLYAEAADGQAIVPWDRRAPHPLLVEWIDQHPGLAGRRTLVVGSGLGEDAAYLAAQGYRVDRLRHLAVGDRGCAASFPLKPGRLPDRRPLNPPAEWRHHFDFVVETYTTQALPVRLRPTVALHVGRFVAPGGTLLVLAVAREQREPVEGPPWPLTRTDIDCFAVEGLEMLSVEELRDPPETHRWRAVFTRPGR